MFFALTRTQIFDDRRSFCWWSLQSNSILSTLIRWTWNLSRALHVRFLWSSSNYIRTRKNWSYNFFSSHYTFLTHSFQKNAVEETLGISSRTFRKILCLEIKWWTKMVQNYTSCIYSTRPALSDLKQNTSSFDSSSRFTLAVARVPDIQSVILWTNQLTISKAWQANHLYTNCYCIIYARRIFLTFQALTNH